MKYSEKFYQDLIKRNELKKKYFLNMLQAFLVGGIICLFGEIILWLFQKIGINKDTSTTLMLLTLITIAIIMSGFGIYDKIGQFAKAGTVIPISGFANSMSSSAMEYRPEGFILGVGANTFKLAGTVVVFGVFSAFIVATIKYLVMII